MCACASKELKLNEVSGVGDGEVEIKVITDFSESLYAKKYLCAKIY